MKDRGLSDFGLPSNVTTREAVFLPFGNQLLLISYVNAIVLVSPALMAASSVVPPSYLVQYAIVSCA